MALSLRGSAENSAISGTDVTVTHPVGTAENDVIYLAYAVGAATNINMSVSTAGWTELADLYSNATTDANLGVYRKIMGATPDSTVTVVGTADTADGTAAVEHVWTGADTTTPEDATRTTDTGSGDPDSPAITTATDNAIILTLACNGDSDTAVTAPTGYSNKIDINAFDTRKATVAIASKSVGAAPVTENPDPWGGWGGINTGWCAATVAIRPATAATAFFPPWPQRIYQPTQLAA